MSQGAETSISTTLPGCDAKMAHPMHTFRVETWCPRCFIEREHRLAGFEVRAIKSEVDRNLARKRVADNDDTIPRLSFDLTKPGFSISRGRSFRKKIVAGAIDVANWLSPTKPSFGLEVLSPEHFAPPRHGSESGGSEDTSRRASYG